MSNNQPSRRGIILIEDIPRSGTPDPAPKRQRTSRSSSKRPDRDSSRSEESRASATRGGQVFEAGDSASRTGTNIISTDPSERGTLARAATEATPAIPDSASTDPSERRTLARAATEATPAISDNTSTDPALRSVEPWQGLRPERHPRCRTIHQWTLRIVSPRERRMPRRHL